MEEQKEDYTVTEVITDPVILEAKAKEDPYNSTITFERIEKHGNLSHKRETRFIVHKYQRNYCDQEDCEFYGKKAVQGHCYSTECWEEKNYKKYIKAAEEWLEEIKEIANRDGGENTYLDYLESTFFNVVMMQDSTMDECIRLRATVARLKNKLGIYGKKD